MDEVIVSISKLDSENVKRVEENGVHNFLECRARDMKPRFLSVTTIIHK